ncbi:transglycosylase, partial [Cohnella sp.]|uniref:transglycosylase n=1 Tax=Cohnella sp. TaxID=1883426 RepID=UPI003704C26E
MADLNKDVVGARIALDLSKIAPAFKTIDQGVQRNAQSFRTLAAELGTTEKGFQSLSKAMDRSMLTAAERKKKIMDESAALVALRKAQTELLQAKTQALDKTNQVTDQKLKAQESIVKKRNDAIEQQEREHQRRMDILQNKNAAAGSRDNLLQAQIDRQFQQMRNAHIRIEQQTAEHNTRMARLNNQTVYTDPVASANTNGLIDKLKNAALHATMFHAVYRAMHVAQEALKEGLVGIESNMAGYIQTNEKYFVSFAEGTHEMVMNTERLSAETTKFIHTAHDLGAEVMDVTESARLWGRMYKDVGIVQELVRQSTQLSVVDLVALEDATKGMESVLAQYGVQIKNVNDAQVIGTRILDSWSKVAHDTMAPAQELAAAFQRTGKIADEVGVSFDVMNGLISAGVRNTALGGANLGNMWKTVLGTIRTDKAVEEIEKLGVATKEVVDGKEQWRRADDILIELSTKVIDKNYDLTQSYADISRGVYQYAKLAASLNAGDILLGTAASIGSTGATLEYLKVQLDTIQRKSTQARTSLLEIFNKAGDDGLRRSIKDVLDAIDQLLIGLTKVPKGVFQATAAAGALLVAYKALKAPILNLVTAIGVLRAAKTIDTVATTANTTATQVNILSAQGSIISTVQRTTATQAGTVATQAATAATVGMTAAQASLAVTTALVTGGITLLAGVAMAWVYSAGKAEKADRERIQRLKDEETAVQQSISQYERQIDLLPKLVNAHKSLQASLDSGTLSIDKQEKVKKQLNDVSHALKITLGEEGAAQLAAANYTETAVQIQVDALNSLIETRREALRLTLIDQESSLIEQLEQKRAELEKAKAILQAATEKAVNVNPDALDDHSRRLRTSLEQSETKVKGLTTEFNNLSLSLEDVKVRMGELGVEEAMKQFDQLAGSSGKASEGVEDLDEKTARLKQEINDAESGLSDLNQTLADVAAGKSLNAQKITDLIRRYPDLESKVLRTKDGWIIEKGAIDEVREAQIELAVKTVQAQDAMSNTVFQQSGKRIDAYGIEVEKIIDVQSAMIELNKIPKASFGEQDEQDIDLMNAILEAGRKAEARKKLFRDLYSDSDYGASSGSGKTKKEKAEKDPLKEAFEGFRKRIDHLRAMGQLTTAQELAEWKKAQKDFAAQTELRWQAEEKVYALEKKLGEEKQQLIEEQQRKEREAFSASEKFISHKKAMGEMSLRQELVAWERIQARYKKGTEERMKADEKVYALKKSLIQDEEKHLESVMKKETDYLKNARQAALQKIEDERQAYISATDKKISEIDRLLAAEQNANDDQDYARKLAEKQARLALLASAVGPEGIKERREVAKEIEDMQREHQQTLRKRDLEGQKKALEDEKQKKEAAWSEEKKAIEKRFDDLLKAFDDYSDGTIKQAELLKQIQITKDSEKNKEILKNLDTFVAQYKAKMTEITSLALTEEQRDLQEYNNNKDLWTAAKSKGDAAEMSRLEVRNAELRNKYNLTQDTGKLQHFSDGGTVQGRRGEAVPVVAHGGEMVLNENQQGN